MIDYDYTMRPSVKEEWLFRFCKDEGLNYLYTLANRTGRRKPGKALIFFKRLRHKRKQKSQLCECSCPKYINEPKGLEL